MTPYPERYAVALEPPCSYGCGVWIGPHWHSVRKDGTLGILVGTMQPEEDAGDPMGNRYIDDEKDFNLDRD